MTGSADLILYSMTLLLLVLIILITRRESRSLSGRLFAAIIISTLLMLFTDLLSALLDGKPGSLNRQINTVSNFILHAFTTLPITLWYAYFEYHITRDAEKLKRSIINKYPLICSVALTVWNLYSGKLYYLDGGNHRVIQPGIISLYLLNTSLFVLAIIRFIRARKAVDRKTRLAFLSFTLFPMLSGVLQFLLPETLIVWSGTSVGLLFFFYFLEIQDLYTDFLTGLPNRRKGDEVLEREMKKADRTFSLIMIDLDGFKGINDSFGHSEGDTALKIFGNILRVSIKAEDFIYRFGGDEFLIVSSCTDELNIYSIIKRLTGNMEKYNDKGLKPYRLRFSAGYTVFDPRIHGSTRELLHDADTRMYEQKKQDDIRQDRGACS